MTEELVSRTGRHRQRYDDKYRLVAGCIPYRYKESAEACSETVNQELEVLMVSSHRSPTKLLFPKFLMEDFLFNLKKWVLGTRLPAREHRQGGWEIDESAQEAACRETLEEAGVRGIIKKDLGSWDFRSKEYQDDGDKGFHRAHVFALLVTEQLDSWPEQNERQRKWVTITEADRRCKHDWMRQALHSCVTYLSSRQVFSSSLPESVGGSESPNHSSQILDQEQLSLCHLSISGERDFCRWKMLLLTFDSAYDQPSDL